MLYKEILVKKILDGNQYVQRNKIREHSILKFFREENEEDEGQGRNALHAVAWRHGASEDAVLQVTRNERW